MKRPQSAKNGQKGQWAQPSDEALSDQENTDQHIIQHRKKVKIIKPDFTTNDFARVLPKKIYQDKERLYSEALQLKQALNETLEENTRLKTKIAILEKEKEKMNKFIQSTDIVKGPTRLDIYAHKSQKDNAMVRNLKKMIRESKDENQYLRNSNQKIKKVIKYTKINELEIQRKMLLEENQRINIILQELSEKVNNQNDYERQIKQLKRYLEEQLQNNKELTDTNQNYTDYIAELDKKFKDSEEKNNEKEKRIQRQLAFTKKKLNEEIKLSDELRKQLRLIKESTEGNNKKNNHQNRPISSNPYTKKQNNNQMQQLKKQNQNLQKQLKDLKLKLEYSEKNIEKLKAQNRSTINKLQKVKNNQTNQINQINVNQSQVNRELKINSPSKIQPQITNKKQNQEKQEKQEKQEYEAQYEYQQQFQKIKEQDKQKQHQNQQKIESIKRDFNEDQKQEKLYEKSKQGHKKGDSKKKQKKKDEKVFKPDKQALIEIKQLLTYRMKAQRYPFDQLKKDIQVSGEKQFHFMDLQNMLKSQPFYLTTKHASTILKYIFQAEHPKKQLTTTSENLIKKLRKIVDNFQLPQQKQEQQMLLRIAEMTSTYPSQLETAFEKVKNGEGTISKNMLIEMFKKLELADNYIELIISQLSLCSQDLQHLSFYGFFERFYISQQQQNQDHHEAIDEEQVQSSAGSSKYLKKQPKSKSKSKKSINKKQYQEDEQIAISKDEKLDLSMKMNDHPEKQYDEEEIISDDEKI